MPICTPVNPGNYFHLQLDIEIHLIIFLHIQSYYIQKLGFFKGFFSLKRVFHKK